MKILAITIGLTLFFINSDVYAVRVKSLYQADLPVISQSESDRGAAIKEGFKEVLIKLSGDPDIEKKPGIKSSIRKAEYYVQEYGYLDGNPLDISQYNIHIHYNQFDIARLFKKAGISFWGDNRPLILIWFALKNNDQVQIIGSESGNRLVGLIKKESRRIGLPIIFPMMDMTDMNNISTQGAIDFSAASLQEAGKRYSPDGFLIGSLEEDAGSYRTHWQLILGSNEWNWELEAESSDEIIKKSLTQATQKISKLAINQNVIASR